MVKNLILVSIVFFNQGNKALKNQDVETKNPIKFIFSEGVEILYVNDIYKSPPTSLTKTKKCSRKNEIALDFHFLNQYHGIVSQILVESDNIKNVIVKPVGVIADCNGIISRHDLPTENRSNIGKIMNFYLPSFYIIYGITTILAMIQYNDYKLFLTSILLIVCGFILYNLRNRNKVPKEFNKYIA